MEFTKKDNVDSDEIVSIENWDNFNLNENLLRGIYAYGFENPSPIQKKAIMPVIKKKRCNSTSSIWNW